MGAGEEKISLSLLKAIEKSSTIGYNQLYMKESEKHLSIEDIKLTRRAGCLFVGATAGCFLLGELANGLGWFDFLSSRLGTLPISRKRIPTATSGSSETPTTVVTPPSTAVSEMIQEPGVVTLEPRVLSFDFTSLECFNPSSSLEDKWGRKEATWFPILYSREEALNNPALQILQSTEDQSVPLGAIVPREKEVSFGSLPILEMETLRNERGSVLWLPPSLLSSLGWTPSAPEGIRDTRLMEVLSEYAATWGLEQHQIKYAREFYDSARVEFDCQGIEIYRLPATYFVDQGEKLQASQLPFPITENEPALVITARDRTSQKNVAFLLSPDDSSFLEQLMLSPENQLSEDERNLKESFAGNKRQKVQIEMSKPSWSGAGGEEWKKAEMKISFPDALTEKAVVETAQGPIETEVVFSLKALVVVW